MNRMEEYETLLARLEEIPLSDPVAKATKRKKRSDHLKRITASIMVVFCMFVSLINLSPTVSAACRELPFLKELVERLTFNPSLRIALEHDYVQMVGLKQTKDGVTGRVEYLIVDQKQVNIFFTVTSDVHGYLDVTPEINGADGPLRYGMTYGSPGEEDDELRHITVDFLDEDVPDYMQLTLRLRDVGSRYGLAEAPTAQLGDDWPDHEEPEVFTELIFDLYFDPQYTAQGKTVVLNTPVELDGQRITITDMEIYPTHMRINVQEDEKNTAWLKSLRFYLELENGSKIETISNGISATGSQDTPSMVSYRAESSYFYNADCIRMYITSADFLDKNKENVYINFQTLESDPLPQGVRLHAAEETQTGTKLTFLVETSDIDHVQLLNSTYYDLDGNEYHCGSWSCSTVFYDETTMEEVKGWGDETYFLEGFHEKEAMFKVHYTHFWIPEEPLVIELTGY